MARPTTVCTWTGALHVAVYRLLTEIAALRTEEGKPWGITHRAAELLREIQAREAGRVELATEDQGEVTS